LPSWSRSPPTRPRRRTDSERTSLLGRLRRPPRHRLGPFCVVPAEEQRGWAKDALDELHRSKIRLATYRVIVVSDETGYFGDSTRGEIEFAESLELTVEYRRIAGAA
jgi:hypothetical protein